MFLETNLHHHFDQWPQKQWDANTLTFVAFYFHPNLDLARAQWASATAGMKTAGGRPNPVLSVTPGYSANPPKGVSPWFPSVTLDVPIETAGKRGFRIAHAEHVSESAHFAIATMAWQVRSAVRLAMLEHSAANARAALLRDQIALQQQLVTTLEQRLAAGAASTPEVSPARIALLKLRADQMTAGRTAAEARGRIAEALGLPLRAIEGGEFTFDLKGSPEHLADAQTLRRGALLSRSDVLGALADYAASQSALQLEIAKQYPDLHLTPGYQYDQGENKWSVGLSIELPVLNRNQGPIAEAKARRDESAAKFLTVQAKALAEIDQAELALAGAREQLKQADELIRLQDQQREQVERSFRAGATDQLEVATARVEASAGETLRLDALIRRQQAVEALEHALQRPFDGLRFAEEDPKTHIAKEKP